ncbi:MAG: ABC transporter ATP-binding protein [Thalassobaculales bacterium]
MIRARGLSKAYAVYARPVDRLKQLVWRTGRRFYREVHALTDASFEIARGETVGLVGRNGSGKSTLLQILAGTLTPSAGEVAVNGRVAALLELGSGFNPEFSGRENVYLNASILGISREEIDARFDDILAFADIGPVIDQPVRTYSSGMYVRLAFAVAVMVDPEVLIVDEALAVGDEAFQRKCLARIEQLQAAGCTILFVSHAVGLVAQFCGRALLMHQGRILADGPSRPVTMLYQRLVNAPAEQQPEVAARIAAWRPAEAMPELPDPTLAAYPINFLEVGARIADPHIVDAAGRRCTLLTSGQRYTFTYEVAFEQDVGAPLYGMQIKNQSGLDLGGAASARPHEAPDRKAGERVRVRFEFLCALAPGTYFMNCGVSGILDRERRSLHRMMDALAFRVAATGDELVTGYVDFAVRTVVEAGG